MLDEQFVPRMELPQVQSTVLVVDDERANVALMMALLEDEGHRVLTASDGFGAIEVARASTPDLILLDLQMPGMTGIDAAHRLKADARTRNIPIVMVTAMSDRSSRMGALKAGIEEFLEKPVDRIELVVRVRNLLRLKAHQDFLANHNAILEAQVAERTQELKLSYREAMFTLTRAAEYKDEDTGAHVQRIGHYSLKLAEALGAAASFCDEIFHAAAMHDVGKIGIPDAVLLKPSGLGPAEWEIMKRHTLIGAAVLSSGQSPYVIMGAQIARSHHERWDGTGYPDGLAGEQIPLPARITCLSDIYDALRSKRPYKPAFTHERTLEIILSGDQRTRPEHFDPEVLEAFRRMTPTFAEIFDSLSE
jgi:putative two-component system response regulator